MTKHFEYLAFKQQVIGGRLEILQWHWLTTDAPCGLASLRSLIHRRRFYINQLTIENRP
jgi:hypothetical protein